MVVRPPLPEKNIVRVVPPNQFGDGYGRRQAMVRAFESLVALSSAFDLFCGKRLVVVIRSLPPVLYRQGRFGLLAICGRPAPRR